MHYTIIDHTADFGIRISGADICRLYENAACALFDLITDVAHLKGEHTLHLSIAGDDRETLLVNWLRELLFLFSARDMVMKTADIRCISGTALEADIAYDRFEPHVHEIKNDIKAVTYHGLVVKKQGDLWTAQIIFDV